VPATCARRGQKPVTWSSAPFERRVGGLHPGHARRRRDTTHSCCSRSSRARGGSEMRLRALCAV
jgi:hypothetical protein